MSLWDFLLEMQERLIELQPKNYTENIDNIEKILANIGIKKYLDRVNELKLKAKEKYEKSKNK